MDIGSIGAIIGPMVGLSVAAIVAYRDIKGLKTPAERRFKIKSIICMGIAAILLTVLPFVLLRIGIIQEWLAWMAFALFFILLVPTELWAKKRRATLRGEKA